MKRLTERDLRFCEEYVKEPIGKEAAIRAGFSERTAKQKACNLLRDPLIQEEIKRLREERMVRVRVRQDEVLAQLKQSLSITIADIIEVKKGRIRFKKDINPEALKFVQEVQFGGKAGNKVKMPDFLRKMELLMRHLGMLDKQSNDEDDTDSGVRSMVDALNENAPDIWEDEDSSEVSDEAED